MKKTPITPDLLKIPQPFHSLIKSAAVYDSSCSPVAQVLFIDKEGGYYLKTAPDLSKEAAMTRFYHEHSMAAEVVAYLKQEKDWMLTRAIPGDDCTHYLNQPKMLCDTLGTLLRELHESDTAGCPVPNRMETYLATAEQGYRQGKFDTETFPDHPFQDAKDAYTILAQGKSFLKQDALLHGDFCLPNVILHHGKFSGLIDVDGGGVGDRHIDLFWGIWSLAYNLKTKAYTDRFLDAYGRDKIEPDRLKIIAAAEMFG